MAKKNSQNLPEGTLRELVAKLESQLEKLKREKDNTHLDSRLLEIIRISSRIRALLNSED